MSPIDFANGENAASPLLEDDALSSDRSLRRNSADGSRAPIGRRLADRRDGTAVVRARAVS
jgi:hypothetical protein